MQAFQLTCVVAVWVLSCLCDCAVSSQESCAKGTTTDTLDSVTCNKKFSVLLETATEHERSDDTSPTLEGAEPNIAWPEQDAAVADEETTVLPEATKRSRCPDRPTSDKSSTAVKLHGSWRVVAAYSRDEMTAFCPELHMCLDPADMKKMTVFWTKAEPYRDVLPRGQMILENDNLVISERYDELEVLKLDDQFLSLRVSNPDLQRTFILSPVSDTVADEEKESHEEEVESNLFGLLIPKHVEMQMSDGPEWYICSLAGFPVRSSAEQLL
ncbi:Protein of unknown function [Gryllus bimaculatus]|nr:Protein of unknown function [Gryllus bimaculatus]